MEKHQILEHIRQIEAEERAEQLLQTTAQELPITALVPVSQGTTPPIVESTIIIQDQPLPDEEPEPIIDMQPSKRRRSSLLLVMLTLISLLSTGLYFLLPILFPTATVTIVPMEKKLTTTATIHIAAQSHQLTTNQIPGRLLPTLTLSQEETAKTTGIGHQSATNAQGYITLYNGLFVSQVIAAGTIFRGQDGVQIITDQTAVIPADTPPINGQVTIPAHAIEPGSRGNIAGYDINTAFSSSILARNSYPFFEGKDARTYPVVNQADIDNAVSHLKPSLTQSIQGAFTTQLLSGEALIQPTCVLKTVPDKRVREEASQVQVSLNETCQAAAYHKNDLQQTIMQMVSQEARQHYGTGYTVRGDVSMSLTNAAITASSQQIATSNMAIATINVNAISRWVYQVGATERQQIERQIAGKGREEALHLLSHLNGIRGVTVSLTGGYNDTLPQDTGRIQVVVISQFV